MYGIEKMKERIKMHQQIYDAEKGFSENEPLYKVKDGSTHISYSKGAVVMVELANIIGEENVNKALRGFLRKNAYPSKMPVTTDLIKEFLNVSQAIYHERIKKMFMHTE